MNLRDHIYRTALLLAIAWLILSSAIKLAHCGPPAHLSQDPTPTWRHK